jgi:hypothetical protein
MLPCPILHDMQCAGIDGSPQSMRILDLSAFCLDSESQNHSGSGHVDGCSIFCADLPGLHSIGLGSSPACVLGLDILRRYKGMGLNFATTQGALHLYR